MASLEKRHQLDMQTLEVKKLTKDLDRAKKRAASGN